MHNGCYVKSDCTSEPVPEPIPQGSGSHDRRLCVTIPGPTCWKVIMAKSIDQSALAALVSAQAVREVRVIAHDVGFAVDVRLGASWSHIRSRREPRRIWLSLTAVGRFLDDQGVTKFAVEL